jgi:pimeloyl-ACP methyl ester carboxylesterase
LHEFHERSEVCMRIVLVHGLGRTRLSLSILARRLSRSGYGTELFPYSALMEAHKRILSRLVARLRRLADRGEEVGLVGHSFGGLLLREGLAEVPGLRVRHLVMLATPNRQPRMAVRVYARLPFRILRGSCGQRLADAAWFRSLPRPSPPYTIVAGTWGWRGRLDPFEGEPNDGIVAVCETLIRDDDQPVLVPALHAFIMNSRAVHGLIVERLRQPSGHGARGTQMAV